MGRTSEGSLFDLMLSELEQSLGKALQAEPEPVPPEPSQTQTTMFSDRGGTKKLLREVENSVQEMKQVLQDTLQQSTQTPAWIAEMDKSLRSVELSLRQMQLLLIPYLNLVSVLEVEKVAENAPVLTHAHVTLTHQDFKNLGTLFHRMGTICNLLHKLQDVLTERCSKT